MLKEACFLIVFSSVIGCLAAEKPNIVFIYTDDLGYGDVACYNPESKVPTPHLDRLAAEGIRFTDAAYPEIQAVIDRRWGD